MIRLVNNGLLRFEKRGNKKYVLLTDKGKRKLKLLRLRNQTEEKWDKKWRIVIFDVFEKNRVKRNQLRRELQSVGFEKLQGSVWVSQWKNDEFVALLKTDLGFRSNVLYFEVNEMENDLWKIPFSVPR